MIFSVLKGATPAVTLGLVESTEPGFFENGATFMWNAVLPVKLSKTLPGAISVGGEVGSFEGASLDQSPWIFVPPLNVPVEQVQGAWTFNVTVDQYVWMHPNDPRKGMGVFGMFAVSDGDPSPLRTQMFVGFGGAAPFEGRSMDSFGAAFYYNDVSNDSSRRPLNQCCRLATSRASSSTTAGRPSAGAASRRISRSSIHGSSAQSPACSSGCARR